MANYLIASEQMIHVQFGLFWKVFIMLQALLQVLHSTKISHTQEDPL